jgi:hypothetical protein
MIHSRPHPVWALLKCVLLLNVLAGFVACAYNIQIGMGIVSGTVILMIVALLLRIIGVCPDRTSSFPRALPPPPTRRPTVIQKHEYILVSNPDRTISVGTRVLAQQPSASMAAYPPPY